MLGSSPCAACFCAVQREFSRSLCGFFRYGCCSSRGGSCAARSELFRSAGAFEVGSVCVCVCVCVWVALLQEQLVEYVARLKDLAAASGEHRTFDVRAVGKLMLDTPRIVQQAILEESHHCGHSHAKYPGSL